MTGTANEGIYTNTEYSLYDRFRAILDRPEHKDFYLYAVSGYFRSSAYFKLRSSLSKAKGMKILVGIQADALTGKWYNLSKEKRDKLVREQAYRELCADIAQARYSEETAESLRLFVADVLDGRLEMKAYSQKIVHAKFYLFIPEGWTPDLALGTLITGSSNFTAPGLGTNPDYNKANYELNVELRDSGKIDYANREFKALWNEGIDLIPFEIEQTFTKKSFLRQDISPRELYLRFLYESLKENIEYDEHRVEYDFPMGFKRLTYQIDAVNEGLSLLERHNGFILADVVGLGKTIVATLIIRSFLTRQDRRAKVLVVAPPAILPNWERTLIDFGINPNHYTLLSSGNLKKLGNPENYALMVVDEAHNFRNAGTDRYQELQYIAKAPSQYSSRKVMLISATPLNNQPRELLNLLALFQETRNSTLGTGDLVKYFNEKQRDYDAARREGVPAAEAVELMKLIYRDIRERILSEAVIRRTRSDLLEHDEYKKDLDAQGIRFPVIQKPRVLQYYLDTDLDSLYESTILALTSEIYYSLHRYLSYLRGVKAERFNVTPHTFEQLSGLMKRFFLKRLDSSFHAFTASLERFRESTFAFIKMYEANRIFISTTVDVAAFVNNDDIEGLELALSANEAADPAITECTASDFDPSFIEHLRSDLAALDKLLGGWKTVSEDPKLDQFILQLDNLLKRDKNPAGKLVAFSESEETINYIAEGLRKNKRDDFIVVSARNRDEVEEDIRANFDANFRGTMRDEYRILLCTDVLAEGVNLHRANTIVNYDTPWNSVRLFQRIGRVNRVGSTADKIFIYNFFPVSHVEDHIELEKKAKMKLQAFHSAFGEDAPIYSSDESVEHFGMFNADDILGAEAVNPRLTALMEIRSVKEQEPELYQKIVDLPPKCHCRRLVKGEQSPQDFVYLRSSNEASLRDVFYLVEKETIRQLSFTEACTLLKAAGEAKSPPGDYNGLASVDLSRTAFMAAEEEDALERTGAKKRSGNEAAVLKYLQTFLDSFEEFGLAPEIRKTIKTASEMIQRGAASGRLIRLIGEIRKNAATGNVAVHTQAEHLGKILPQYIDLPEGDTGKSPGTGELYHGEEPDFILGEWFIG
ncbi:putative helicase, SNF2/RAD54 family [Treponema primitia ZAS-2]|uniref:Putative helicase, SNF2/RAD54 family n=1 Tax=Treponema primitia (strain ATCC BAA-887 / DSM 12427 / ZAS-2) TaxID=545694 RepID=F5YM92_TREPZ|nr:SNF2-related protein [Treponema primitia]AEF86975.1 putative helicase, SNF2/RAD54 family [Treponema primitia ZAS-2]